MKKLNLKKIFVGLGIVLAVILLYLCFFPIRWKVDREQTAYLVSSAETSEKQELMVKLEGTYEFYLLKADRFKGHIQLEAYPETAGEVDLVLDENGTNLVYQEWEGQRLHSTVFGMINASSGMKDFVILKLSDGALNKEDYVAIISGDMTEKDAEQWNVAQFEE